MGSWGYLLTLLSGRHPRRKAIVVLGVAQGTATVAIADESLTEMGASKSRSDSDTDSVGFPSCATTDNGDDRPTDFSMPRHPCVTEKMP